METSSSLLDFLKYLQGRKTRLKCEGATYVTSNLQVISDSEVAFNDLFGHRVFLKISQIVRAEELR